MSEVPVPASGSTVSELFLQCIDSFSAVLVALSARDCLAIRLGQVSNESFLEQFNKLRVWGDQTSATLPAQARGSLDDTLRHDSELKDVVLGILLRLKTLLDRAIPIAERKFDGSRGSDQDSVSSVTDDSSSEDDNDNDNDNDSDSDNDNDNDNGNENGSESGESNSKRQRQRQCRTIPKITFFTRLVFDQIRSLYDLSALLRRPTISSKYIRSIAKPAVDVPESETMMLRRAFRTFDYRHITERFLQWRGQTKAAQRMDPEKERPRALEIIKKSEASAEGAALGRGEDETVVGCCEDTLWLCWRFTEANMRRREQIRYWTEHPYDPKDGKPAIAGSAAEVAMDGGQFQPEKALVVPQTKNTARPPVVASVLHPAQPTSTSGASKRSFFSTVPITEIHETETNNTRPRTLYTPTEADMTDKRRCTVVPNPPKSFENRSSFECPYCGTKLSTKKMQNRQSWKRHVFRDLRPYVCTFENCPNAAKLFLTRNDWVYHELQMHRQEFVCRECNAVCPDRPSARRHLEGHYQGALSPSQLSAILDVSSRPPSETTECPCIVCGRSLPLSGLQTHLATHMEEIALFALPMAAAEVGESLASGKAAKSASANLPDTSETDGGSRGNDAGDDVLAPNPPNTDSPNTHTQDSAVPQGGITQTAVDFERLLAQRNDEYALRGGITSYENSGVKHDSRHIVVALIESIVDHLVKVYKRGWLLGGLIIFHTLTLKLFINSRAMKEFANVICNMLEDEEYNAVVIAATFGERLCDPDLETERMDQLQQPGSIYFTMCEKGAVATRHNNTQASAHAIIRYIANRETTLRIAERSPLLKAERDKGWTSKWANIRVSCLIDPSHFLNF
ncbi:hypothetical protein B0H67DRAFT_669412 [Lasiosphaeris hirsuta]|uniref:C2H2-type domain-containing protein n=1 Tax=Lasiosphaeris hirsuta TaxID=260670 RepID=A0AA40DQI2_9PEZI|nr:hypothetical protein B0H67DRAFT_669412 [Lasiosphaeris hirsuta]